MLIDEIWHAAGDDSTDVDWYVKRTILGGIYSTTELYMLTDTCSGITGYRVNVSKLSYFYDALPRKSCELVTTFYFFFC